MSDLTFPGYVKKKHEGKMNAIVTLRGATVLTNVSPRGFNSKPFASLATVDQSNGVTHTGKLGCLFGKHVARKEIYNVRAGAVSFPIKMIRLKMLSCAHSALNQTNNRNLN